MTGKGLICELGNHIPIEGADRIVQVNMFGETIITQKTNVEGTLGILFDCETCLSKEYASANNMFSNSELNKDKSVKGYMADSGRIRPIKLKGVKCSGLWMPLETLYNLDVKIPNLNIGHEIDEIRDIVICKKYVSKKTEKAINSKKIVKENLVPTFKEHLDTDQWGRNKHKVKRANLIIITEKLHGTSGRCAYLPTFEKFHYNRFFKFILWINGEWANRIKLVKNGYKFVAGSRRVVKSIDNEKAENKQHYYNSDLWTQLSQEKFKNKLRKGETIYFEIVGYTPEGSSIMPTVSNEKLKSFMTKSEFKTFIEKYGEKTSFSYNCFPSGKKNEVYVYRITHTNEDGHSIDLSWKQVKNRCSELGVNHVPEIGTLYYDNKWDSRDLDEVIQEYTDAPSINFPNHIREGVCVRVETESTQPLILKNKSFIFKVLEGIIKDSDVVDLEESN